MDTRENGNTDKNYSVCVVGMSNSIKKLHLNFNYLEYLEFH